MDSGVDADCLIVFRIFSSVTISARVCRKSFWKVWSSSLRRAALTRTECVGLTNYHPLGDGQHLEDSTLLRFGLSCAVELLFNAEQCVNAPDNFFRVERLVEYYLCSSLNHLFYIRSQTIVCTQDHDRYLGTTRLDDVELQHNV